jgi:hypothetical protein
VAGLTRRRYASKSEECGIHPRREGEQNREMAEKNLPIEEEAAADDLDDIEDVEEIDDIDEDALDDDVEETTLEVALEEDFEEEIEVDVDDDDEDDDDEDEDDDDDHDDETAEALEELENQEMELLDEEANEAMLVDEVAELRAMRREELTLNVDAQSQKDDEFVCQSCFMVKRTSQIANKRKMICFDCVD